MSYVQWQIHGTQVSNCNCSTGCPCQFNALPTHGDCRAFMFMQIEHGHFGDVKLDGLRWGGLFAWPGPIHLGNGTAMVVIDERADAAQRAAIEAIAQGRETEPGTLITQVFSTTLSSGHPTVYSDIELRIDRASGTASLRVPGLLRGDVEPIRNPITGQPHRATVSLPTGFEYTEAEFLAGSASADGPIELKFSGTHAHIAPVAWSTHGLIR